VSITNVFVYGTLKPGERNYPHYCQGRVKQTRMVFTWGELYELSLGYPGMTVGNNKVRGVLLTFPREDILVELDDLEDYSPTRAPQHNQYQRRTLPVYDLNSEYLGEAWGYLMELEQIRQYRGKVITGGWWSE
jgi:gamma-glutamylcyclotransferase (GGCT)/AIG2-like uncharacterized protein YtfP